jgi:methyl-accepting chemotaxis protein
MPDVSLRQTDVRLNRVHARLLSLIGLSVAVDLALRLLTGQTLWLAVGLSLVVAGPVLWLVHFIRRMDIMAQTTLAEATRDAAARENDIRVTAEVSSDLAGRATEARLAQAFETEIVLLVGQAASTANGVRDAAHHISAMAEQTATQTEAVSGASHDIAASAESVAASVEELAVSVTRVTADIRAVSEASFKAMENAGATNVTVQRLADSAAAISQVVRTIAGIAEQTNLLALNATIEAARAGDAGKGFSVVASEVKALARQTASATKGIEAQISQIQIEMTDAMTAIDGIASTVAELGGISVAAAGSMEEQADVTHSIAQNALHAAARTKDVVTTISGLRDSARLAQVSAEASRRQVETMAENCHEMDITVRNFVRNLLAG